MNVNQAWERNSCVPKQRRPHHFVVAQGECRSVCQQPSSARSTSICGKTCATVRLHLKYNETLTRCSSHIHMPRSHYTINCAIPAFYVANFGHSQSWSLHCFLDCPGSRPAHWRLYFCLPSKHSRYSWIPHLEALWSVSYRLLWFSCPLVCHCYECSDHSRHHLLCHHLWSHFHVLCMDAVVIIRSVISCILFNSNLKSQMRFLLSSFVLASCVGLSCGFLWTPLALLSTSGITVTKWSGILAPLASSCMLVQRSRTLQNWRNLVCVSVHWWVEGLCRPFQDSCAPWLSKRWNSGP